MLGLDYVSHSAIVGSRPLCTGAANSPCVTREIFYAFALVVCYYFLSINLVVRDL